MLPTIDRFVGIVALISTIITSLRAGSRALFLSKHNQIGVLEGPPLIGAERTSQIASDSPGNALLAEDNENDRLRWELAFAFCESVRLGLSASSSSRYDNANNNDDDDDNDLLTTINKFQIQSIASNQKSIDTLNSNTKNDNNNQDEIQINKNKKHGMLNKLFSPPSRFLVAFGRRLLGSSTTKSKRQEKEMAPPPNGWDYQSVATLKISIPPPGNNSSSIKKRSEIKAFAPHVFESLRRHFGISTRQYIDSLLLRSGNDETAFPLFVSFQSNSKGAARSGGMFFFTRNGAYMIKTIKSSEANKFLEMLPRYHKYMQKYGRRSLLTRFCGLYSVKRLHNHDNNNNYDDDDDENDIIHDNDETKTTGWFSQWLRNPLSFRTNDNKDEQIFIVMNSVFPAESQSFISERFDLKGSTVGRECSPQEKKEKKNMAILKDLDLVRDVKIPETGTTTAAQEEEEQLQDNDDRDEKHGRLIIGPKAKAALLAQLRRDVELLVDCDVMDYSLLVGIVNMEPTSVDSWQHNQDGQQQQRSLQKQQLASSRRRRLARSLLSPIRILGAPLVLVARRIKEGVNILVSSVATRPLPYYGAGACGVDGGALALLHGKRRGKRALYYMGLIDFLQPWDLKKVLEHQFKGMMGHDVHEISCVNPKEYGQRFLNFIDAHVS